MGRFVGVGDVADGLRHVDPAGQEGEGGRRIVAVLHLQAAPVDRAAVEARRRAGLEPAERQAEAVQRRRQPGRGRRVDPAGRPALLAQMDDAAQEGSGRDDDGAGADRPAVLEHDAGTAARAVDRQVAGGALDDVEARLLGQDRLHGPAVQLPVGLGPRSAHRRALAAVEDAELDAGPVDRPAHDAVQRVDLAHQMALGEPADRRIARHDADGVAAMGQQHGAGAGTCRGRRRLAAGMAAADHDDIRVPGARPPSWAQTLHGRPRSQGRRPVRRPAAASVRWGRAGVRRPVSRETRPGGVLPGHRKCHEMS